MQKLLKTFHALSLAALLGAIPAAPFAHSDKPYPQKDPALFSGLDTGAGRTVQEFHRALREGNKDAALNALANAVVIFEGGGVERSAQEYAGHHLPADIAFLQQMNIAQQELQIQQAGDLAFAYGRSRLQGEYKGKALDLQSMETLVLRHIGDDWKIMHVHWSSK